MTSYSTDSCVCVSKQLILIVHVDDVLIFRREKLWIDLLTKSLFEGDEKFELTDEGNIDKYLGVCVQENKDGTYEIRQPFLIDRMLTELTIDHVETKKRRPPVSTPLLYKDLKGKGRLKSWNYRSVIGMLKCFKGITRPDTSMAVHQCARFSSSPMLSYERLVTSIERYLLKKKR